MARSQKGNVSDTHLFLCYVDFWFSSSFSFIVFFFFLFYIYFLSATSLQKLSPPLSFVSERSIQQQITERLCGSSSRLSFFVLYLFIDMTPCVRRCAGEYSRHTHRTSLLIFVIGCYFLSLSFFSFVLFLAACGLLPHERQISECGWDDRYSYSLHIFSLISSVCIRWDTMMIFSSFIIYFYFYFFFFVGELTHKNLGKMVWIR